MLKLQLNFTSGDLEGKTLDLFLHENQEFYLSKEKKNLITNLNDPKGYTCKFLYKDSRAYLFYCGLYKSKFSNHKLMKVLEIKSGMTFTLFDSVVIVQVIHLPVYESRAS